MATVKKLIDANELKLKAFAETETGEGVVYVQDIDEAPTVDAVEVVHCEHCVNHGNCLTEDLFRMARIEKPYCCVGKMDGDGNG